MRTLRLTFCLYIGMLMVCLPAQSQVNLNQGLLAYYPFSGNANDASGHNRHGTAMNGVQLTTDKFGNPNSAYKFDGIDDHIIVFDNGALSPKNVTVSAWVYAESSSPQCIAGKIEKTTGNHSIYCVGINYDVQSGFFWGLSPANRPCNQQIPYDPNNPFIISPDYFSTNAWHCVVGTFQDSIQKMYIDGVLIKSRKINFKDLDQCNNTNFLIGRWWDGDPIPFKGKIDEVRVYDRALNQEEIHALCESQQCANWLQLTTSQSFFNIGDLDIPGTQITVEANFNRTTPYTGDYQWAGDLVSKHHGPEDVNYLLRPNGASITTSDGFYTTPPVCDIQLNKTYHVAMTYDGATLKFFRNGFLMSSMPATGTLYQNNHATKVGIYDATVHNTQFIGYVNEVRIWNVVRTQQQINEYMNASLPPSGRTGLLAYYTFDNLLNKQGNAAWNGTLSPVGASINQANPTCSQFVPDNCNAPSLKLDFTYKQNVCNPLQVQFFGAGANLTNAYWNLDGAVSTGNMQPVHSFPSLGVKTIRFAAQSGALKDTITKTINLDVVNDPSIVVTPDTTICAGATKQLRTKPALSFCWTPSTYLSDPNSPNPITSTPQNITYYFTSESAGTNLIVNGDFSAGNTGFNSDYIATTTNGTEGEYIVGTNAQAWNPGMSSCGDHTAGNGKMMIVNGSQVADAVVWKQAVTIAANTNYAFSTWIQSVHPQNPAQLQFSINGQPVGSLITAGSTCNWLQFYTTWNSGSSTTAVISVINKNTAFAGNDFALDDISFAPVSIRRDSVKITVDKPVIDAISDVAFCAGSSVQLNATGGVSYSWQPGTGLSNAGIANPVASPAVSTKYYITGTNANGCSAKDSVMVTVNAKPTISKTRDTSVCPNSTAQLMASGGVSYVWSPAATLSNPNIANPVASPTGLTYYTVQVTDANNCINKDSVKIDIRQKPAFTISAPKSICEGKTTTLTATGGDDYAWSPAAFVNNSAAASPVASPNVTTQFSVYAKERVCNYDSTMNVTVTVNSNPDITATKSNDIDCTNAYANLSASGASAYSWFPATGLDYPTRPDPVARINTSVTYTVTGTNQFGCASTDTITVKVSNAGNPTFEVPNAFSPNGDRINDCFGLRKWARVNELEFTIYNRWGQKVFSTTDPNGCWDGTLNGKPQDSGGFVYVIKAKSACGEVFRKGVIMLLR